jgi:hypothetical protein
MSLIGSIYQDEPTKRNLVERLKNVCADIAFDQKQKGRDVGRDHGKRRQKNNGISNGPKNIYMGGHSSLRFPTYFDHLLYLFCENIPLVFHGSPT